MSKKWRIIDCSNLEGHISSERGALCIAPQSSDIVSIPVADVAVVLVGPKVHFSTAVIHRVLADDVTVLFCDWKGVPEGGAYAWGEHARACARQRAQAQLSVPRQKNAWARLIRAKIHGQYLTLEKLNRSAAKMLASLEKEVRSGDPCNCEAQAARIYWQALWGDEGFHRYPGAGLVSEDCRNSHLDYAYTVLRGHGIRAVLAAGLAPALGLFHHGRSNNFALVDDLIEPFRPVVDFYVAQLSANAPMNAAATRQHLVAAASQPFNRNGLTIPSALEDLAQHFGQYCENDLEKLPVVAWDGTVR